MDDPGAVQDPWIRLKEGERTWTRRIRGIFYNFRYAKVISSVTRPRPWAGYVIFASRT